MDRRRGARGHHRQGVRLRRHRRLLRFESDLDQRGDRHLHHRYRHSGGRRWRGPDGNPLPFRDDEAVLEFLRTAEVVSARQLGKGINRPLKVLLDRDGLQAHAVFRRVDAELPSYRPPGSAHVPSFRDSFLFEPAAYKLGLAMGFIPKEYGGGGVSNVDLQLVAEEIAAVDPGFACVLLVNGLSLLPLVWFGDEALKQKWLTKATGDSTGEFLSGWVVSEPAGMPGGTR